MTYGDDFPIEESEEIEVEEATYPSVFGLTLSPTVGGILIGVLGIAGAGYLLTNFLMTSWDKNQQLQTKIQQTETIIQDKQNYQQKLNEAQKQLIIVNQQKQGVLSLFSDEKSLDTLLLDLNSFIADRSGNLEKYEPDLQQDGTVVTDSSYGAGVNGKLKSKSIAIAIESNFDQLQSFLSSIEQMQALLVVKEFSTELGGEEPQKFVVGSNNRGFVDGQPKLKTSFKLQVLMPLEPAQIAASTPATPPVPNQ
ncbi:pilus assembly protein PilO [Merismopedia glauca]|uniref:Pilus assembly protein PilO n=1 Tax=Merismopedia glauca CCAP 1448/3 TaxID=1296344 RepID=A0A2T1BXE0_9CYAN|nr:pilus assembly protein PilO [Merismopedia glauca]PSB00661.1 pilus assembly protein PilO [Merismopedia glauca CCAP 1448/3]